MLNVKGLSWILIDDKYIMMIGRKWKGSIVPCFVDIIIVNKDVFEKNKHCFINESLKAKIMFIEDFEKLGILKDYIREDNEI